MTDAQATECTDTTADVPAGLLSLEPLRSPAYPRSLRILTVVLLADLLLFGLWSLPALQSTSWSASSLLVWGLAALSVYWVGGWVVYSKTELRGDTLHQTWIWDKHVTVQQASQLKLVHWPGLQAVMAPRLLVRKRNGGVIWIHSANPLLLTRFCERVAHQTLPTCQPPPQTNLPSSAQPF